MIYIMHAPMGENHRLVIHQAPFAIKLMCRVRERTIENSPKVSVDSKLTAGTACGFSWLIIVLTSCLVYQNGIAVIKLRYQRRTPSVTDMLSKCGGRSA